MSSSAKAFHDDQQEYIRLCKKYGEKPELGGLLNEPYPWGRHCESLRRRELSEATVKESLTAEQPVRVCPERDIECGHRKDMWCGSCPKRKAEQPEDGAIGYMGEIFYPESIKAERDALRQELARYKALVKATCEDMECLPACNKHGHDENCPVAHPQQAWNRLREKVRELEADAARLDWLEACEGDADIDRISGTEMAMPWSVQRYDICPTPGNGETLREAIDAAMQEGKA